MFCSKCSQEKPESEFYLNKGKPMTVCKECRRQQARSLTVEERREKNRRYREKKKALGEQANKGNKADQHRRWREGQFRWRKEGFEAVLQARGQVPAWADQSAVLAMYRLAKQLREDTGQPWVVDHIVPIRGERASGLHCAINLQIILQDDNRLKGNAF